MDAKKFLEPKEIEIDGKKFVISKIPAIQAQQVYRNVMIEAKDDGDVAMTYLTEDTALALLEWAGTAEGDEWASLDSADKVNFCCQNLMTLIKLEAEMIRYNFGFLFDGSLQKVLGVLRDTMPAT